MVSPVARVAPPPPPSPEPNIVAPALAGGGAAAAAIAVPRRARGGFPWRRAIVPGILVLVLAVLALRGGNERTAGLETIAPQRTAQPTATRTVAPTTPPTTAPTVAPTVAPTAAPTAPVVVDDYGNTAATATVIAPGAHKGTIAPAGDVDFFRFIVPANTAIGAELRAETLADGGITIINAAGTEVAGETNTGADHVARLTHVARDAGVYFIRVRGARTEYTGTYTLTLSASPR
jgi:hypothetical protein